MDSNSGPSASGGYSTLNPEDQAKGDTRKKILESSQKNNSTSSNNNIHD